MSELIGEAEAVRKCIELAEQFGYGNLIDRLHIAWAAKLMQEYNMSVEAACRGAHIQDKERIKRIAKGPDPLKAMREYCFLTPPPDAAKLSEQDRAVIRANAKGVYTPEFIEQHIKMLDAMIAQVEADDSPLEKYEGELTAEDRAIIERVGKKLPAMIAQVFGPTDAAKERDERAESDRIALAVQRDGMEMFKIYTWTPDEQRPAETVDCAWLPALSDGKPGWKRVGGE